MNSLYIRIPLLTLLFCYLALTQVYRFVHVHAVETDDGYNIELSIHHVHHPHDDDFGHDDHQEEADHLTGDWDHIYSSNIQLPPFHSVITSYTPKPNILTQLILTEPRTGPLRCLPILPLPFTAAHLSANSSGFLWPETGFLYPVIIPFGLQYSSLLYILEEALPR